MKEEFRRRLVELNLQITRALNEDTTEKGLMPALFKVINYLWTDHNAMKKK